MAVLFQQQLVVVRRPVRESHFSSLTQQAGRYVVDGLDVPTVSLHYFLYSRSGDDLSDLGFSTGDEGELCSHHEREWRREQEGRHHRSRSYSGSPGEHHRHHHR